MRTDQVYYEADEKFNNKLLQAVWEGGSFRNGELGLNGPFSLTPKVQAAPDGESYRLTP